MSTQYLFVYGTLKKDILNIIKDRSGMYDLWKMFTDNTKYVGEGMWNGKLYLIEDGEETYPGAITSSNPLDIVYGEVVAFDSSILPTLDEYEECSDDIPEPKLYKRIKDNVRLTTGDIVNTWIYVYNLPIGNLKQIKSGIFYLL